jgi:MEMO1 family protein
MTCEVCTASPRKAQAWTRKLRVLARLTLWGRGVSLVPLGLKRVFTADKNMNGIRPKVIMQRAATVGMLFSLALSICTLRGQDTPGSTLAISRQPAVAGLFYPQDERQLKKQVDELLAAAKRVNLPNVKALVCPHAGYTYSGAIAAAGYKQLADSAVKKVIVIGPSHYAAFKGVSLPTAEVYGTPLGKIPISTDAKAWAGTAPFVAEPKGGVVRPSWSAQSSRTAPAVGQDTPETWEHSVEVQMPFLQRALKGFEVLPMIMGEVDPAELAKALAQRVDEKTIIVASSDLSHYHDYRTAKRLDGSCVQAILDGNLETMSSQEACGKGPVLALMHLARTKGWKARLLESCNSGDVGGDKDRVVGYAAVAFYAPKADAFGPAERKLLLEFARKALTKAVADGALPEIPEKDVPPILSEKRACFVTLTKHGELRGCIGTMLAQEPLYRSVLSNARNAALRDPRFPAVAPGELPDVRIEISVLSEPKPLVFSSPEQLLTQLQPGEDGVVLRIGGRMATFLPQVWSQIRGKTEFLDHLSVKAGCDPSAWKGKDTSVSTYHVECFEEAEQTPARN